MAHKGGSAPEGAHGSPIRCILRSATHVGALSGAGHREEREQMGLLEGKRALIFGLANDHSIAWGIAQAFHREGATVGFASVEALMEKRVKPLAARLDSPFVEACDVQKDEDIARVFAKWKDQFGELDILIHAVAFANKDDLKGEFMNVSREGFLLAQDVSAYSLVALAREARPLMSDGGTILTLSYYGAEKAVVNYNVMGVAKASLEACVRYLAVDLGKEGIRVNAISAGPVRTLSASGVYGFKKMHRLFEEISPMRRPLSIDDLGNSAVYLCSEMSRGTTGEIHYVDGGYNLIGVPEVVD